MGVVTKQKQPKLGLERNANVLLKDYAAMAPETFSGLVPEERRSNFKILRLRVRVQPSAILEVSGTLGGEGGLGRIPRLERLREKDHGRRVHGQGL